jgi:ribosomal-protein-serine acetyltransferase
MPTIINPLLLDLPEQIETDRLLIRAPRPGDGPVVNAAIRESQEELRRWMIWAQEIPHVQETEEHLRQAAARFALREDMMVLLFHRGTGVFIGASGMHNIDWTVPSLEIGYWLHTAHTGQGYMTEAVLALTDYAMEHFSAERIEIRCDALNRASAAVAERAGFRQEGYFRNHMRSPDGTLRDTLVYAWVR